jgi:hypothetical protein
MEKKKMRKIEAGAAIFVIVAVTFILGTGPSIIADPYQEEPFHDMVRVTLSATDSQSSVEYINYSITCSNPAYQPLGWQQFDASQSQTDPVSFWFELNKLGDYTVQYYAADSFGNVEATKETTFSIVPSDQTPPTTTIFITDAIPT